MVIITFAFVHDGLTDGSDGVETPTSQAVLDMTALGGQFSGSMQLSPFARCGDSQYCATSSVWDSTAGRVLPMRNVFNEHLEAIAMGDLTATERASEDLVQCLQNYKSTRILAAAAKITVSESANECSVSESTQLLNELDIAVSRRIAVSISNEEAVLSSIEWLLRKASVDDKMISETVGELTFEGDTIKLTYKSPSKVSVYWKQAWVLAQGNRALSAQLANKADALAPMFISEDLN